MKETSGTTLSLNPVPTTYYLLTLSKPRSQPQFSYLKMTVLVQCISEILRVHFQTTAIKQVTQIFLVSQCLYKFCFYYIAVY